MQENKKENLISELTNKFAIKYSIDTLKCNYSIQFEELLKSDYQLISSFKVQDIYVLTSKNDYALRLSRWIAGGQGRLGQTEAGELTSLGISVIDLSEIDDVASNSHGKFTDSPSVVQLIGRGLQSTETLSSAASSRVQRPIENLSGLISTN